MVFYAKKLIEKHSINIVIFILVNTLPLGYEICHLNKMNLRKINLKLE